jgi:hypothetical protein
MVVLLFSISAHEAGHAWMSNKFGDDTARCWDGLPLTRWPYRSDRHPADSHRQFHF